jgi:Cellulase (glycosyl hydrolase family 5)/Concanavalin A-like lectin/glucanases superfamily
MSYKSLKKRVVNLNVLDTFTNKRNIDNFSLGFIAGTLNLSNPEIDHIANILIQNGSTYAAVHAEAFRPDLLPYTKRLIQRLTAKGLKVHFRTGFSVGDSKNLTGRMRKADGTFEVYESGSISNKTEIANTAIDVPGTYTINNSSGTLTDNSKNWKVDEWKGYQIYCKSVKNGTNMVIYINGNTTNTLNLSSPFQLGKLQRNESDVDYPGYQAPKTTIFSELGKDIIDKTKGYEISYQCANDNAFTDTNRGLYKHIADNARIGLEAGAVSFGCSNELNINILQNVPGSIFENGTKYIEEQKKLVGYIKSTVPGYPEGYTVSEGFWNTEGWINSGSISPLDFLSYTNYEEESTSMWRAKKVCDKFGADKIQFDEFSLYGDKQESKTHNVCVTDEEYARLIINRVKWYKYLGVRNIFRWEFLDYRGFIGEEPGFGYITLQNKNIIEGKLSQWFADSYSKNISEYISNWSIHFRPGKRVIEIPSNQSLNLANTFTIQFKLNTSWSKDQTLLEKKGSYSFYIKNTEKLTAEVKINGTTVVIEDTVAFGENYGRDRWMGILLSYDGSKLRLFVQGKLKNTVSISGNVTNNTAPMSIGGEFGNADTTIHGRIQDVEICKQCLVTSDYLFKQVIPTDFAFKKSPNSVLRILTDQSSGDTIFDSSGNNNNGIISGSGDEKGFWSLGYRDKIEISEKFSNFWNKNRWTGYNIASLEFTDSVLPGIPDQHYPSKLSRGYAKWCFENGVNAVRIPILLERLIPTAFGEVNQMYSQIIKTFLNDCRDYKIKAFLDFHNYGFYNFGSDGKVAWGKTNGSSTYSLALHQDFYEKIFNEFDSITSLEGYMYNEPHDLSVPTNPSNYKTTATCTIFQQAAINKLRSLGSTKWFGWTSDDWGGLQNIIASKWGANFDFPWSDPLQKTFLDLHFYHDLYTNGPSHSGTFGGDINDGPHRPQTRDEVLADFGSVIARVNEINKNRMLNGLSPVPLNISEIGSPYSNTSTAIQGSDYMKTFDDILAIFQANNIGFFYFAIGEWTGNNPKGLFADVKDLNNNFTVYDVRHKTIDKYLNKYPNNIK